MSPDGKFIVSGGYDKTIKIWDLTTATELKTFNGHKDIIFSVAFSPDQKFIISGCKDKAIKIWSVVTGAEMKSLTLYETPLSVGFVSQQGVFVETVKQIATYNVENLQVLHR